MALRCWLDCCTNYLPPLALIIPPLNPHRPRVRVSRNLGAANSDSTCALGFSADPPAQGEDEPLPDDVPGADRLSAGQRLLLHIPPTQLAQVRVLQLPRDQLLQVKKKKTRPAAVPPQYWAVCVDGEVARHFTPDSPKTPTCTQVAGSSGRKRFCKKSWWLAVARWQGSSLMQQNIPLFLLRWLRVRVVGGHCCFAININIAHLLVSSFAVNKQ